MLRQALRSGDDLRRGRFMNTVRPSIDTRQR
jgi:hypothetical protein